MFPRWQVGDWCCAARSAAGSGQCAKPAAEEEQQEKVLWATEDMN